MTSRYSLRKKLIFDPSHPKLPRNAVFEIHEVTPDGPAAGQRNIS
jgi:hypothetical protein